MKTATFIKQLTENWRGDARLYELSEPVKCKQYDEEDDDVTSFVIVSAVFKDFSNHPLESLLATPDDGNETYIFPASKDGDVLDWIKLPGSFKGALDHARALRDAGFTIKGE